MNRETAYSAPRADLGEAFQQYLANDVFIADKVFVPFLSGRKSGTFSAITRESIIQSIDARHANGATFAESQTTPEDVEFVCKDYGIQEPLTNETRENYAANGDFQAELVVVKSLTTKLQIAADVRLATALFNTSTFTGTDLYKDYSSAPWDTAASDIPAHIQFAMAKVRSNTGMKADTLVVSETTLQSMLANTKVLARFPGAAAVTADMLTENMAALFGLKKLIVGGGVSTLGSDIWADDYAMVCKTADPGDGLEAPAIGRNIYWDRFANDSQGWIEQFSDPNRDAEIYRVRHFADSKMIDPYFGFLLKIDA